MHCILLIAHPINAFLSRSICFAHTKVKPNRKSSSIQLQSAGLSSQQGCQVVRVVSRVVEFIVLLGCRPLMLSEYSLTNITYDIVCYNVLICNNRDPLGIYFKEVVFELCSFALSLSCMRYTVWITNILSSL